MYAVMFTAASHLCTVSPDKARSINILAMKVNALSEINAALLDPKRATSDALLGAVGKMAAYEAMHGDPEVFAAHMKGLQTMLKIRGGFSALGQDGLLERMLVWLDVNTAHATGRSPIFGTVEFPTVVSFAGPDQETFGVNSPVHHALKDNETTD